MANPAQAPTGGVPLNPAAVIGALLVATLEEV